MLEKYEDELIQVYTRLEELKNEQDALESRRKELTTMIREQWLLSSTTQKTRNGVSLELKPLVRWSVPADQVGEVEELFQQCGLGDKIKHHEAFIHWASFNAALSKMTDPEGEFKLNEDDILKKYPAISVFKDTYIEIKSKK